MNKLKINLPNRALVNERIANELNQLLARKRALDDLTVAVVKIKHHKSPSRAIEKAMREVNSSWHISYSKPNEEKWDQGYIKIWGNGLPHNHLWISFRYDGSNHTWDYIFESIRALDPSKSIVNLTYCRDHLDEFYEKEEQLQILVSAERDAFYAKHAGKLYSVVESMFPAVYRGLHETSN